MGVLTPFITTILQFVKVETTDVLSQMLLPKLVHALTVVKPVIIGLAPVPYAPIVIAEPALPLLLMTILP